VNSDRATSPGTTSDPAEASAWRPSFCRHTLVLGHRACHRFVTELRATRRHERPLVGTAEPPRPHHTHGPTPADTRWTAANELITRRSQVQIVPPPPYKCRSEGVPLGAPLLRFGHLSTICQRKLSTADCPQPTHGAQSGPRRARSREDMTIGPPGEHTTPTKSSAFSL